VKPLDLDALAKYVDESLFHFHQKRLAFLQSIQLNKLFNKNPFLIHAKRHNNASDLIVVQLETFLSIYEEELFGDFLKELALKIAEMTCGGYKSAARGVDLEFIHNNTHYIVSIRSGTNWIDSSQQRRLAQDLNNAVNRVKQSRTARKVESVLGMCYGKVRTTYHREGYLKVAGQNFWYLISEDENLYTDIVEPIGYRAREHNENFAEQRDQIINRFTRDFTIRFCDENGAINWQALVEFNSGNYDLDSFGL
jgi:hypothetical protein